MEDEVLQISADATDDNGINSVQLNYRINGKASSSNMTKGSGNTYIGQYLHLNMKMVIKFHSI